MARPARRRPTAGSSPRRSPARGVDVAWCERVAALLDGRGPGGRPGVGGEHPVGDHAAGRGAGVDRPDLRAGRRGPVLLADGPGLDAADRRHRGPREHAGDARPQAARRRDRGRASTTPTCPAIEAYAGELNQVWTNLIDNAVDAMDGEGTLRVAARADDDAVVVEIGDTGTGMSPDVAARAFDAFYTTKEVGKGTGPRPRHRPPDRGRAARRHDRHRPAVRRDGAAGPAAALTTFTDTSRASRWTVRPRAPPWPHANRSRRRVLLPGRRRHDHDGEGRRGPARRHRPRRARGRAGSRAHDVPGLPGRAHPAARAGRHPGARRARGVRARPGARHLARHRRPQGAQARRPARHPAPSPCSRLPSRTWPPTAG